MTLSLTDVSTVLASSWDAMHWHSPWAWLLLIPAGAALGLVWWQRRAKTVRSVDGDPSPVLPTLASLPAMPVTLRQRLLPLLGVLRVLAMLLLVAALARPQMGLGRVRTSTDAVAIQLVVDRSGSMRHRMQIDGQLLTRLDVVQRVLREFLIGDGKSLTGRPADLIGLVTFARFAETACPLVRDPRALADLVDSIRPAVQQFEDGTAVGDALALAAARLRQAEQEVSARDASGEPNDEGRLRIKSKVIVLLTDGENNAGERMPLEAAELAREWGIRVYTIGIGAGAPAYVVRRDPLGGEQLVPMAAGIDESELEEIARLTGGRYFRAQDGDALRSIYGEIDRLERTTVRTTEFVDYAERFAPLAIAAAALIALELALASTVLRRVGA
ncbi:MAG: VWA domain-containing protein [Phycisphaeraceae bacterium]|nr:VWA domain-containing protein [Phycisphaeraceae bacterium]